MTSASSTPATGASASRMRSTMSIRRGRSPCVTSRIVFKPSLES